MSQLGVACVTIKTNVRSDLAVRFVSCDPKKQGTWLCRETPTFIRSHLASTGRMLSTWRHVTFLKCLFADAAVEETISEFLRCSKGLILVLASG